MLRRLPDGDSPPGGAAPPSPAEAGGRRSVAAFRRRLGVLLGLGTVIAMVVVAWHYADVGEPVAGAPLAGAGMVSMAAILVTGKGPMSQRRGRGDGDRTSSARRRACPS
ncbi:hypothetical protein ACRAWF_39505 [Streptomyces sp. L7]